MPHWHEPCFKVFTVTSTFKPLDLAALDQSTGGAFNAMTSGERSAKLREWLTTEPSIDLLAEVYREMSSRDKGAAKLLKEKLDELKRLQGQDALASDWAQKAEQLLQASRLNIGDAMAWQRDAAKAGAPYIEIHTGKYAETHDASLQAAELTRIRQAAEFAASLGLIVNAGHGLHYHNVQPIAAIPQMHELNIGHAIVARAVFSGLDAAVREMKRLMVEARR